MPQQTTSIEWPDWIGIGLAAISLIWQVITAWRARPQLVVHVRPLENVFTPNKAVDLFVFNRRIPTTQILALGVEGPQLMNGKCPKSWNIQPEHTLEHLLGKPHFCGIQQLNLGETLRQGIRIDSFGDYGSDDEVRLWVTHSMSDKRSYSQKLTVGKLRAMAQMDTRS